MFEGKSGQSHKHIIYSTSKQKVQLFFHFGNTLWVHLKKQMPIPYLSSLCRTQPSLWNYTSLRIPKDDTTKLCNLGFCCWSYAAFLDAKNAWGSWGSVKHTQNALKRWQNHLIWFGSTPLARISVTSRIFTIFRLRNPELNLQLPRFWVGGR